MASSERDELEQNLNAICANLPTEVARAALVHMVGGAAGLKMELNPQTSLPSSFSAASELTEKLLDECKNEIRAEGPYAYEERKPSYHALLSRVIQKAEKFKNSFDDPGPERDTKKR